MSKQQKRIIDADEIRLFDQQGRMRIGLNTSELDGEPQVALYDEDQLACLSLGVRKDGSPIISFLHPNGPTILGIGVEADGQSGIEIRRPDGTLAVSIGIDINQDCRIEVRDVTGATQWATDKP